MHPNLISYAYIIPCNIAPNFSSLLLFLLPGPEEGRLLLGTFTGYHHGVSGSVYALNETALVIKNFTYDGQGPDAFFWAGIGNACSRGRQPYCQGVAFLRPLVDTPRPSHSGLLLAYPFSGHHFEYDSREAPVLGAFDGTEDVVLILPDAVSPGQLKWLSVWCRAFTVNFGDIIFHSAEDEEEGIDARIESHVRVRLTCS